jgi:hypothetical protein
MDLRKEIVREFTGHDLTYATIEGGEAWGRRKQITMSVAENELPTSMEGTIGAIGRLLSEAGY